MKILVWNDLEADARRRVLARPKLETDRALRAQVSDIIDRVRRDGDDALRALAAQLDRVRLDSVWADTATAVTLDRTLTEAIDTAIANVHAFHEAGTPRGWALETSPGVHCSARYVPLSPIGLYVPAGSAPLPSTAIMLAVPARIAGCRTLVLATPPNRNGQADPAVLAVARQLGIRRVLLAGGAQAIAAMAYGTQTVPACLKVFGPGNRYVAEAKRQVAEDPNGAAQDLPAGPSEVLIIADGGTDPALVAMDLLSQAEHGPDSQVFLLTDSDTLATAVQDALAAALATLPRRETAAIALENGAIIRVNDLTEAIELSEDYAPEHLLIQTANADRIAGQIQKAGSVFVGRWTPESLGDYVSGTNHTLPTGGWARSLSGLSTSDFMRRMTVQSATPAGLKTLGPAAARLAAYEGLDAHRQAVEMRLDRLA